jgi:Reverse transcriptase (RNA-dependent DNA polymerase)
MIGIDKEMCYRYAKENNLIGTPGWGKLNAMDRKMKLIERNVNMASIKSSRFAPIYQYGRRVPRNHKEAVFLDHENKNTKWAGAEFAELTSIFGFQAFKDQGHAKDSKPPSGSKKITVHFVYAVKHDGRHKARLVTGGHLTDAPIDSVYSSVVSLRGVRMVTFIAELNKLQIWSTDVGNAYLESYTKEKVHIIAGSEFAAMGLEGHILLIDRALYGLKFSGLRWYKRLSDVLRGEGFFPSRAESDIWMRCINDHYEYLCVMLTTSSSAHIIPRRLWMPFLPNTSSV